jgi:hypothetical protein
MKKLLSLLFLTALTAQAEVLEGIAKSKSGEFIYRETHNLVRNKNGELETIETRYSRKDGSEFASFNSDFKKNKYVPDTVFVDQRFGEKIITSLIDGSIEFKFFKKDLLTKTKKLKLDDQMVMGQGFDNFLQDKIINGSEKSKSVHFVVIPQADFFRFKISDESEKEKEEKIITIEPESFFIRALIDKIKLTYSDSGKTLKRFQGISNLNSDKNESQVVDIELNIVKDKK